MAIQIIHHDRNDHITDNFFHWYAMITSLAKVRGHQSPLSDRCFLQRYIILQPLILGMIPT